jgi:spore maturation protein CgeB
MLINKNSKVLCFLPKYSYGLKEREYSTEYQSFYYSLKSNFKNFFFFNSININKSKSKINEGLIKIIHNIKPDIIFSSIAYNEIYIETLQKIKIETNSILLNWCSDDSWRLNQHSLLLATYFDYMITTEEIAHKNYKLNGQKSILSNWGCPDLWITKPKKSLNCKYDVIFLGSSYFGRDKNIEYLKKNNISVTCYGYGWKNSSLNYRDVKKKINNSKIAINFSKSRNGILQTKARVFENTGCGSMCITETSPSLRKFFSTNEVIDFKSLVDLKNKINFYLKNPKKRDIIANRSFKKCKSKYSYSKIVKKILYNKNLAKKNTTNSSLFVGQTKTSFIKFLFLFFFKFLHFINNQKLNKIIKRIIFEIEYRYSGSKVFSKHSLINTIDEIIK